MYIKRKLNNIFYGWWIVGACLLIWLSVTGIAHYGFTTFIEPLRDEFGWSYAQISLAASLRGMEVGFLAPLFGYYADRIGPRRLMFMGTLSLVLGLLLLSRANSLLVFYAAFVLIGIGASTSTNTVPMTAITNWFRKKVSLAAGIISCGAGVSGLLVPVLTRLIDEFGWRTTVTILGICIFVLILPLTLMIRHKPEDYGYLPDGETEPNNISQNLSEYKTQEPELSTRQALKSVTFWRITVSMVFLVIIVNAMITHIMPFLSTVGIERSIASLAAGGIAVISIVGRLTSGWLGDRMDRRWIAIANFAAMSLSLLLISYVSPARVWLLVPSLILFGIGYGGNFIMNATLTEEYFGRSNYGAINGLMIGVMGLGGMLGPLAAGLLVDSLGNYYIVWLGFACLAIIALFGVATIRKVDIHGKNADKMRTGICSR